MATGPLNVPDSLIQETPVISPLPFWQWNPAATGSPVPAGPRGWIPVTPVRTRSPSISVTYPTSTPGTSVMAFHVPGRPANGIPSARARGLPPGVRRCGSAALPPAPAAMAAAAQSGLATVLTSSPMPVISMLTVSPATSHGGGVMPSATPDGVPLAMMSPGSSVMASEM